MKSNRKRKEKKAKAKFNKAIENRVNNLKKVRRKKQNEYSTNIIYKQRVIL